MECLSFKALLLVSLVVAQACAYELVVYAVDTLLSYPPYNFTREFEIHANLSEGSVLLVSINDGDLEQLVFKSNINPAPDVVIGIDNIHEFDLGQSTFLPLVPPALDTINKDLLARVSRYHLFPYEYGRVTLIANTTRVGSKYDLSTLSLSSIASSPEILKRLMVQDPDTSVTGAAFLLATIATFGDSDTGIVGQVKGQGDWKQWWRKVLQYSKVYPSWSKSFDAFYAANSTFELMVSYELDPTYSYCVNNQTDTASVNLGGQNWYLIEALGVHNQSTNPTLALQFVNWFLSEQVQQVIPNHDWMFPAQSNITLPACFNGRYTSPDPEFNELINLTTIETNILKWYKQWHSILNETAATSSSTTSSTSAGTQIPSSIVFIAFAVMLVICLF